MNKNEIYFAGRRFLFLPVLILCFTSIIIFPSSKEKAAGVNDFVKGERILFLGDSITQDGRYVSFIEYYFFSQFPNKKFDIVSIGLSSETVSGLTEPGHPYRRPCLFDRLDSALIKTNPKLIVACYGMNDGIYHPQSKERMKAYENGIYTLIDKAKSIKAKLVIVTPPMFDTVSAHFKPVGDGSKEFGYSKPYNRYNDVLGDYSKWLMTLKIPGVTVIDLHTSMTDYALEKRRETKEFSFSKDGIHPQAEGHLFMAQEFMKGIGVKLTSDGLNSEVERLEADSLFKLVSKHRFARSKGWLAYIGFTLEKTVKTNEIDPVEEESSEILKKIYHLVKTSSVKK